MRSWVLLLAAAPEEIARWSNSIAPDGAALPPSEARDSVPLAAGHGIKAWKIAADGSVSDA